MGNWGPITDRWKSAPSSEWSCVVREHRAENRRYEYVFGESDVALTATFPIDEGNVQLRFPKDFGWAAGTRFEFGVEA